MKKQQMNRAGIAIFLLAAIVLTFPYQNEANKPKASRYIKLDKLGKPLSAWQGPWSCIVDKTTGLVWENKTDDESIHDALWSFSWYQNGKGVENSGDCYFEAERCDTADLVRRAKQEQTCGFADWRLPTEVELMSLVIANPKTGQAKIRSDFFSYTKRGDYWTADSDKPLSGTFSYLKKGARSIDFIEGKPRDIPYRNAAFLRLVTDHK